MDALTKKRPTRDEPLNPCIEVTVCPGRPEKYQNEVTT
jgi:hypothetical protein